MQLRWKASLSATCLHAATSFEAGLPLVDPRLSAALQPAVAELRHEINASGLSVETLLPLLAGLASEYENNRQLIEVATTKMLGAGSLDGTTTTRLAGCVAKLESALLGERPQLVEELAVRGRPLREQWEARGPGLMHGIARLVGDENFVAPAAEVVLVAPLVGGHGRAYLQGNRVIMEAVLANPHDDLPETLRLGWLLAQLNFDLPRFCDPIPGSRLPRIASLATLPLVLAAAETVELTQATPATLSRAIACWHLSDIEESRLFDWWHAYSISNTRWPVALAALNTMLPD